MVRLEQVRRLRAWAVRAGDRIVTTADDELLVHAVVADGTPARMALRIGDGWLHVADSTIFRVRRPKR